MLLFYAFSSAQTPTQKSAQTTKPAVAHLGDQNTMTPWMTEIWDPEVKIIQPGVKDSDAPSDAIVLFNGTDISSEWEDTQGKPFKVDY